MHSVSTVHARLQALIFTDAWTKTQPIEMLQYVEERPIQRLLPPSRKAAYCWPLWR
jgi:hypothetical protein